MRLHIYQGLNPATKFGLSSRLTLPHPSGVSVACGDAVLLLDPISREGGCYGFAQVLMSELSSGLHCSAQPLYLDRRDVDHCFAVPDETMEWYTVPEAELAILGGAAGALDYLCHRSLSALLAERSGLVRDRAGSYGVRVRDAIGILQRKSREDPAANDWRDTASASFEDAFRVAVKSQYRFGCAICGVSRVSPTGQFEVKALHIFPPEQGGSHDLRNGLALCRLHAWAFEHGLFGLDDSGRIHLHPDLPEEPMYEPVRAFAGREIACLADELRPHPLYLAAHRQLHGL